MNGSSSSSWNMKIGLIIAFFLIYVVWGSTYFFIGVALKGFPPFLLGGIRFSVAGVLLLGICMLKGENIFKPSLIRKSAVSGIVLLFIDMAVIMLAQKYLTSSLVAIIASSTAIWIMALDVPRWKHNFKNPYAVAGIVLGFVGVVMLFFEQLESDTGSEHGEYGILLLIFGCISWALGTLYAKYKSSKEESVNAFAGGAWQMLFASVSFWICALIFGDFQKTDFSAIPNSAWFSLAYLIIFGSIFAYSAYIWLLKVRTAAEVGTHAYVNPVVALLLGVFVGGENVTAVQVAGLAVILLSVAMVGMKRASINRKAENL